MNTEDARPDERDTGSHPRGAWLPEGEEDAEVPWSRVSSRPPIAARLGAGTSFTRTVDGVVHRVDREYLWLRSHTAGDDVAIFDVRVSHHLPTSLDLRPLVGRAVRATTVHDEAAGGTLGRTLTINDHDGRVWLIARSGAVRGVTHVVSPAPDEPVIHAALSQRPEGPLVVGTTELQRLVPLGASALFQTRAGAVFHALFLERRQDGTASYVIADDALVAASLS